jgi:hypothetical protein
MVGVGFKKIDPASLRSSLVANGGYSVTDKNGSGQSLNEYIDSIDSLEKVKNDVRKQVIENKIVDKYTEHLNERKNKSITTAIKELQTDMSSTLGDLGVDIKKIDTAKLADIEQILTTIQTDIGLDIKEIRNTGLLSKGMLKKITDELTIDSNKSQDTIKSYLNQIRQSLKDDEKLNPILAEMRQLGVKTDQLNQHTMQTLLSVSNSLDPSQVLQEIADVKNTLSSINTGLIVPQIIAQTSNDDKYMISKGEIRGNPVSFPSTNKIEYLGKTYNLSNELFQILTDSSYKDYDQLKDDDIRTWYEIYSAANGISGKPSNVTNKTKEMIKRYNQLTTTSPSSPRTTHTGQLMPPPGTPVPTGNGIVKRGKGIRNRRSRNRDTPYLDEITEYIQNLQGSIRAGNTSPILHDDLKKAYTLLHTMGYINDDAKKLLNI